MKKYDIYAKQEYIRIHIHVILFKSFHALAVYLNFWLQLYVSLQTNNIKWIVLCVLI